MIDYLRQLRHFDPNTFAENVNVVGCGATGSYLAFLLGKMGVKNIDLFDFDVVEDHNLPNQVFKVSDVGRNKAEALAGLLGEFCGVTADWHNARVTKDTPLPGITYMLVDSMAARKDIFEGLKYNLNCKLMIETRVGIDCSMVYCINPNDPSSIEFWENHWYSDEDAEESPCNDRMIAPTACTAAAIAAWKLIKYHKKLQYERSLTISHKPSIIT